MFREFHLADVYGVVGTLYHHVYLRRTLRFAQGERLQHHAACQPPIQASVIVDELVHHPRCGRPVHYKHTSLRAETHPFQECKNSKNICIIGRISLTILPITVKIIYFVTKDMDVNSY